MARQPAVGGFETSIPSTSTSTNASSLPEVTLESLGAKGDGVTDDTAAFQSAANKGKVRITGRNLSYKISSAFAPGQGNYWDMQGATVTVSAANTGVFVDQSLTDGSTVKSNFVVWGGNWVGGGGSTGSLPADMVYLQQWTNVFVGGCTIQGFSDGAAAFLSCGKVWFLDTYITAVSTSGQRNAIRFNDGPFPTSTLMGDFMCMGNVTDRTGTVPNAAINVSAIDGMTGDTRAVVALNDFTATTSFAVATTEVNSYSYRSDTATITSGSPTVADTAIQAGDQGQPVSCPTGGVIPNSTYVGTVTPGVSFLLSSSPTSQVNVNATGNGTSVKLWAKSTMQNVLWLGNTMTNLGTGATLEIRDSGGQPVADSTKIQRIVIMGNSLTAAGTGTGSQALWFEGSYSTICNNWLMQTGSSGRVLLQQATPSVAQVTHNHYEGNYCYATNATQTNAMVQLDNGQDCSWVGGRIVGSASAGTGAGLQISGNSVRTRVSNVVIEGAAGNGMTYTTMVDARGNDILIRNCNAGNNAQAGSNASGILCQGVAPAGTLNEFNDITIIDDRGSKQMGFGLNLGTTATTPLKFRGLTIIGAGQTPLTTTSIGAIGEITGFSTDAAMTGYGFSTTAAATAGASPFTTTARPYDQILYLHTVGGLTAVSYSRGTTALPFAAGASYYIRRNETLTLTWATTAPTFDLVPLP